MVGLNIFMAESQNVTYVVVGTIIIILTYLIYTKRCFKCKSLFTIEEDEEKREDFGVKKRLYTYYLKQKYNEFDILEDVESSKKTYKRNL